MAKCAARGNEYNKTFTVMMGGKTLAFDSFECAIQTLAPRCANCGCTIIGHGVEKEGTFFCCANCAAQQGIHELEDRA